MWTLSNILMLENPHTRTYIYIYIYIYKYDIYIHYIFVLCLFVGSFFLYFYILIEKYCFLFIFFILSERKSSFFFFFFSIFSSLYDFDFPVYSFHFHPFCRLSLASQILHFLVHLFRGSAYIQLIFNKTSSFTFIILNKRLRLKKKYTSF